MRKYQRFGYEGRCQRHTLAGAMKQEDITVYCFLAKAPSAGTAADAATGSRKHN